MHKNSSLGMFFGLMLIVQACNLRMKPISQPTQLSAYTEYSTASTPTREKNHLQTPTFQVPERTFEAKTPVSNLVMITAIGGNLFIRRGPHLAFNPIGVLYKDSSVSAIGRDMLSRWLQVGLPSQPGSTGWISIQTRYSKVAGEIDSLPVIDTTDWPAGAFIRNCTHHQMLAQPGDFFLPSSYEFPDNEVSVFPGIYTVYDLEVSDKPVLIETVELREGLEVDIREDADGERRKCP